MSQLIGKMQFRPRARLLRILGEELISDEIIAIVELVRNSYDADANSVHVEFIGAGTKRGVIRISDDGHGMTKSQVQRGWMEPGTLSKRKRRTSESGKRRLLGKKGVGRFAADKLATKIEIQTKRVGSPSWLVARLDWNKFAANRYLDELDVGWEKKAGPKGEHGTTLTLAGARPVWTPDRLKKLKLELVKLQPPVASGTSTTGRPFSIVLTIDGKTEQLGEMPVKLLETAPYRVTAKLAVKHDSKGGGRQVVHVSVNGSQRPPRTLVDQAIVGPFSMTLSVWPRDVDALQDLRALLGLNTREVRNLLNEWCGVAVYRDGFRVYPYGEEGDDWLGLDKERINVPGSRLSNNQLLGVVSISEAGNPGLGDQTNREGLFNNPEFRALRAAVLLVVKETANVIIEAKRKIKADAGRKIFSLPSLFALGDVLDDVGKDLDRTALKRLVSSAIEEGDAAEKQIFEELARYRRLLSLSVVSGRMAHEVRQHSDIVRRTAATIGLVLRNDVPDKERLSGLLGRIDASAAVIAAEIRNLSPFVRARRKVEVIDVPALLTRVADVVAERAARRRVTVVVQAGANPADLVVDGDVAELFQAVHNCVDNSLHWVEEDLGKIELSCAQADGWIAIRINDNGPGIDPANEAAVFEPYWTTKPDGTGLGLPIAGEIVADHRGELTLVRNQAGKGCAFQIRLPVSSSVGERNA